MVHGAVLAGVGAFGAEQCREFGVWWPGALDAIRQLAALAPGDVRELGGECSR